MFTPTGFNSFSHYFQFAFAKEFRMAETGEKFEYAKTVLEHAGRVLTKPLLGLGDHSLMNLTNPLMIVALTTASAVAVTIAFYPKQLMDAISKVVPPVRKIKAEHVKLGLFILVEATILGIGLRTFGRLSNSSLMAAWTQRTIMPILLGTVVIRQ